MGKALLGTHMAPRAVMLIDEVRVLRARVAQLEAQLAEARLARELLELPDEDVLDLDVTTQQAVSA